MMNLKETINFKTLREKGPNAVDIHDDEVVQIVTRNSEIKVIITQEYFLTLLNSYNSLLVNAGAKKQKTVDVDFGKKIRNLETKMANLLDKANEDGDEEWQDGRAKAKSY